MQRLKGMTAACAALDRVHAGNASLVDVARSQSILGLVAARSSNRLLSPQASQHQAPIAGRVHDTERLREITQARGH